MSKEELSGSIGTQSVLGSLAIQTSSTGVPASTNPGLKKPVRTLSTTADKYGASAGSPTTQRVRMYQLQKAGSLESLSRTNSGHLRSESSFDKGMPLINMSNDITASKLRVIILHVHSHYICTNAGFIEYVKGIEGITSPKIVKREDTSFSGSINTSARNSTHVLPLVTPISPIEIPLKETAKSLISLLPADPTTITTETAAIDITSSK